MQIDLFTFIAQIVNFLILVALLRYFLYQRIVRAMDERKRKITERMDEAEAKKEEAEEQAEHYEHMQKRLQNEKEKVLSQAQEGAEARRKELVKKARREVEQNQKKWQDGILRQRRSFTADLRNRAGEQVCAITRKVLKELADAELETHAVKIFMKKVSKLSDNAKQDLEEDIRDTRKMVLRSAFDLPEKLRSGVKKKLEELGGGTPDLDFEKTEDLICGIELDSGGRVVSWSADGYLESLEESLSTAFERFESEDAADKDGQDR